MAHHPYGIFPIPIKRATTRYMHQCDRRWTPWSSHVLLDSNDDSLSRLYDLNNGIINVEISIGVDIWIFIILITDGIQVNDGDNFTDSDNSANLLVSILIFITGTLFILPYS